MIIKNMDEINDVYNLTQKYGTVCIPFGTTDKRIFNEVLDKITCASRQSGYSDIWITLHITADMGVQDIIGVFKDIESIIEKDKE